MISIVPVAPEHFELAAKWLSIPEWNEWLTTEWRGRTVEPVLIGIAVRNKRNRIYVIQCEGTPCGLVALADWDPVEKIAMIWYLLGDLAYANRNVVTHAVAHLVRLSFETLDIDALHAWIMEDNAPSRRVLEKNGFREAGRLRSAAVHAGRRVDRVYFDLVRSDPR